MKPVVLKICFGLGIFILLAPILYFAAVVIGLQAHVSEDRIVFGSLRILDAIRDYDQKPGHLPAKLDELVPEFLKTIPEFPEGSKVDYRVSADGTNWTLDLHWTDRKRPLIYRRTTLELTSEDVQRRIDTLNGGYLLKTTVAKPIGQP